MGTQAGDLYNIKGQCTNFTLSAIWYGMVIALRRSTSQSEI